jgi:murein tripeptide amidase MpaA
MSYLNVAEVETAVVNLASAHPSLCQLITLPNTTVEGRTSHALLLGGGAPGSRDCVMVIGGQHAKEWGSCEIILNLAVDLITAFETNTGRAYGGKVFSASQIQQIMNGLHVILFPLVNPDGRKFSQDNIASNAPVPEWRRNRNSAYGDKSFNCIGVDLNRNYDFMFDFKRLFAAVGFVGLDDPCKDVFQGPSPFSEPESKNVRWLIDTNPRTHWFVDLHSGTQNIRLNWGDDEAQSTNPAMNFRNPAFDLRRGVRGDADYKEYVPPDDLLVEATLATRMHDAIFAVRGLDYPAAQDVSFTGAIPGTAKDYVYARHFVDPSKGKIYGFTIEWGDFQPLWPEMQLIIKDVTAGLIELCRQAPCAGGITAVGVLTSALTFEDVPTGIETSRAAVFSVQSCAAVQLNVVAGPAVLSGPGAFTLPLGNGSLPAAPSAEERDVRIWVSFKGQNVGDITTGTVTVNCPQTGQNFVIPINANTIAQPTVASVLVLDKSGSMDDPSGIPGLTRLGVLHAAAPSYVVLLPDKDGIGLVSFDTGAHAVMPVTTAGALGSGAGRVGATSAIAAHATNPAGMTAIGDGVELAHSTLEPLSGFDVKTIVVFTDGQETAAKYIADVQSLINERVFAIGLGTVQEVNPVALNSLVNFTGGYLLMTDALGPNDTLRLAKYFVQILAGVTNVEIVIDPDGLLPPGAEARIPFELNGNDYSADVILLSTLPGAFDFQVETPDGVRIDHTALGGVVGVDFVTSPQINFYRMSLPLVARGVGAHQGRWNAVLKIPAPAGPRVVLGNTVLVGGIPALGVPYSVIVQARTSLTMAASLTQPSYEPGTRLDLRAVLTEIGLPVEGRGHVRAEVKRPDGSQVTVALAETEPGVFEGSTPAPLAGIYPVRFRAAGSTLRGFRFTREQIRSGLAWRGEAPPRRGRGWDDLLRRLLVNPGVRRWLETHQIDVRDLDDSFGGPKIN